MPVKSYNILYNIKMKGGRRASKKATEDGASNTTTGLIAGGLGYLGGSVATSTGSVSTGDAVKYGVKCDVDNTSQYCQDVKNYNRFQMLVTIISTIIGAIIFFVALYYIYTMYFSKKKTK
jgi:hypothetical protein